MSSPDPPSSSPSSSSSLFPVDSPAHSPEHQTYQPDQAFFRHLAERTSRYTLSPDEDRAVRRAWATLRGSAAAGTAVGLGLGRVVTVRRELKGGRAAVAYGVFSIVGLVFGSMLGGQAALTRLGRDLEGSALVELVRDEIRRDREARGLGEEEYNPNWPFPKDMGPWPQGPPPGTTLYIPPPPPAAARGPKPQTEGAPEGPKRNKYGDPVE